MSRAASALHGFEYAEGDGRFGGGAGFGYDDYAEAFAGKVIGEFGEIIFADVLAGKENFGFCGGECVFQGFDDGFGAKIAAADAYAHHRVAAGAQT